MANTFLNAKSDLTTTNLTTVYTVPSATTAIVKSVLVSEDAGSGTTIDVTLVDASGTIFSLFKAKAVGSNTTIELLTQPLVVEGGNTLTVQSSNTSSFDVAISYLNIKKEVTT